MLAVIGQFPNHVSILAIIRVEVLNAGKRRLRDVGVISAESISIVVNDVNAVIELAHFHLFFAVCGSPIAKQRFLHFLSRARCDWNFVFARTESQNAQASHNAEPESAMNQIRCGHAVLVASGDRPSSKSMKSDIVRTSLRSVMLCSFFLCSNLAANESRHPSFDANAFQTKRSPSFKRRPFSKHHSRMSSSVPPWRTRSRRSA